MSDGMHMRARKDREAMVDRLSRYDYRAIKDHAEFLVTEVDGMDCPRFDRSDVVDMIREAVRAAFDAGQVLERRRVRTILLTKLGLGTE